MNMRLHHHSEMGVSEDDYSIAVGLAGLVSDQRNEAIIQASKIVAKQDIKLGLDKIYFDYNGLGGYGLIENVVISNTEIRSISIHIDQKQANELDLPSGAFAFYFSISLDSNGVRKLQEICEMTNTSLENHSRE